MSMIAPMWFAEECWATSGDWSPVIYAREPTVEKVCGVLRIKYAGGVGPRLREKPKKVEPGDMLKPDGSMRNLAELAVFYRDRAVIKMNESQETIAVAEETSA